MPMTSIARTHLVYQFIILTLVFLGIGYYELLLERRFMMFLLIVPTFLYQLAILCCCTELIPMPTWINLSDSQDGRGENASDNPIGPSQSTEENCTNKERSALSTAHNDLSNINRDLNVCARKYEFKTCKGFSLSPVNSVLKSPPASKIANGSTPLLKQKDFAFGCSNSDKIQSSEPTKRYFFPYRQKRLEQWIESKENSRPFKIRNWQSRVNDPEQNVLPTSNSSDVTSTKNSPDSSVSKSSPVPKCPSVSDCSVIPESEMTKRYTFPFRQKREQWMESDDEMDNSTILPSTPYWHTVGYSVAVKQEARRRRRSVSSSLLTNRPIDAGKFESERCKDFSQSVEISRAPSDSIRESSLKTASSTTTAFGKMKIGIVNCFSKIKRDNGKESSSKRRSFKSIFQSRENINTEQLGKEHRSNSKANIASPCGFYPTYIPFQNDRFESDVRKRMLELPKAI